MVTLPPPLESVDSLRRVRLSDILIPALIVGVLSLITFPALTYSYASARDRQMDQTCADNLRRIGQAMTAYLSDHGDRFPAWTPPGSTGFISVEDYCAATVSVSGAVDTTKPEGARATISLQLEPYLPRTRSAWACPADFGPFTGSSIGDWAAGLSKLPFKDWPLRGDSGRRIDVSYGYRGTNTVAVGPITAADPRGVALAGYRLDAVKRPARCSMFRDIRPWHYSHATSIISEYQSARLNLLCVDGHIISLEQGSLSSSPYNYLADIRK